MSRISAALAALALAGGAWAQAVPSLVHFQAKLLSSSGAPFQGSVNLGFAIFKTASGGTALYTESQTAQAANGNVSVLIGGASALAPATFTGADAYLEVTVNGETLTPRRRLVSTPYAANSQMFQSRPYSLFVVRDTSTFNVGIGTGSPSTARLAVSRGGTGTTLIVQNGGFNDEVLRLVSTGDNSRMTMESDAIYSTLPLHIGNGQNVILRTDVGGSVGVGTTSPSEKMHVVGNARAAQLCLPSECRSSIVDGQFFPSSCPSGYRLGAREGIRNPGSPSVGSPGSTTTGQFFCFKP